MAIKQQRHGLRRSPEYLVWANMKNRTTNTKCPEFKYYGGRGIIVCERWANSFLLFYQDMGPRPSGEYQIDRRNNNGNYEPSNCQWSTKQEQMLNRGNAAFLTAFGETRRIKEWVADIGISETTVYRRMKRGLQGEALLYSGRYQPTPR